MSAISWTAEAPAASNFSATALRGLATRLAFGLGLVIVTSAAYSGMLLTVLLGSSILQL